MKFSEENMEMRTREMCGKNEFWRDMYEHAPEGAKKRLRVAFWASRGLDEREDLDQYREYREQVESKMTYEDAAYLAKHFPEGAGKEHYVEMRENLMFASLRTADKLDEATDFMTAAFERLARDGRDAVAATRTAMKAADDPCVRYEWFWSAAGGNGEDCAMMGDVFDHGHGVRRDAELARYWFTRGALSGDGDCCCRLGALFGDEDDECFDFAAANFWFREALRRRCPTVKWMLGWRLASQTGAWARTQNPELGVALIRSGLGEDDEGHCNYHYGRCLEEGYGVERNLCDARRHYRRAAEQGHCGAKEALERLEEHHAEIGFEGHETDEE